MAFNRPTHILDRLYHLDHRLLTIGVPIDGSEYAEEYCISEAEVQEDLEAVQSFDRPIEIRIRGPGDRIRGPSQKGPGVVVWLYKSHRRMAPLFTDNLKHSHSLRLEVIERKK
jgi:hypothetical protein